MTDRLARVGPYQCGAGRPLLLIAGPCVIETLDLTLHIARRLKEITADLPVQLVFKASYDKANRTSVASFSGAGLAAGLETLEILELNGNQLPHPAENQTRKPAELIDFILQNQERRRINTVKLLVLGEPGAGKTSLIRRLVERRFDPDEPSSSGITVQRWPVL